MAGVADLALLLLLPWFAAAWAWRGMNFRRVS
jgi:hypothetical protein